MLQKLNYPTSKIHNSLKTVNPYLTRLKEQFGEFFMEEDLGFKHKGHWRKDFFYTQLETPIDIEIGTGNGFFFAHHTFQNPQRRLIGFEIKYRCLYQTLKRMRSLGSGNGIGIRSHAANLDQLFTENEIDNIYMQFPDPWPKKRHHKNRLIQMDFLNMVFDLQKKGSFFEFKTDSLEYFEWTLERIKKTQYKIERLTYDLHSSEWNKENFQTHFERLWTSKGLKTMLVRVYKN